MKKKFFICNLIIFIMVCMTSGVFAGVCDNGHTWVAPTCIHGQYCSACGFTLGSLYGPLGHAWTNATCTSPSYCTRCGATNGAALGHAWYHSSTTAATCTTNGSYNYTCSRCWAGYSDIIWAPGHNWGNYETDKTTHWKTCYNCWGTGYNGGHSDGDGDGYCITCGYHMYIAPNKPTITVKDTDGNVITSTWINKDLTVTVNGSTTSPGRGGVTYQYKLNNASYGTYNSPVSYTSLNTNTTFYARAYNSDLTSSISAVANRVLPKIEKTNPTFTISIDSSDYEKKHTATIKFADAGGSALKADTYTLSYTWTNSATTPSSYENTMSVTMTATNEKTVTISKDTGTGIYHLHVKINKQITDNATNVCPTTTLTIPFNMDNMAPVIEQKLLEAEPVALNSGATYSMDFVITEEHSGLVTGDFIPDDIVVKVNGVVSSAKKELTYKSVSNGKYEYNLVLSNIKETGRITLEIKNNSIPDYATNKCVETKFELTKKSGSNFIGPYADNSIPVVLMNGPVTSVSVPVDKNLSGVLDKRYISQYYTVKIPFRILDIGGQDFVDILELKDLIIKVGDIELTPPTKNLTTDNETTRADNTSKLTIYQKDYTLTLSGLTEDGFLEVISVLSSVKDLAGNINVQTPFAPYTDATGSEVRLLVDNIKPQPTIKRVSTPEIINGKTNIEIEIFIKDLGSGIRGDQFAMSDMNFQIDGATITSITKSLEASTSNNYETPLGGSNSSNYTYILRLSNIAEDGNLRIQITTNKIIDKSNNGNDPVTLALNTTIDNTGPKLGPITTNVDKNGEVFGEAAELEITNCSDQSGISKYEWQRSEDGINFTIIQTQNSVLSNSKIQDVLSQEKKYYYKVTVTDTLGNSSTSEIVEIKYRSTLDSKPTLRLTKEQVDSTVININGVIKSKTPIISVKFDGSELPKSYYENNVKVNNYEITTTFAWPVTQNGIYEVEVMDEKGNKITATINVNEFDFTPSEIHPVKQDATLLTPAQIIFTSDEPVRIVDDDLYPGITFDTDNFSTRVIATISPNVDFDETKTFEFENKGLTKVNVDVDPPILTRHIYLRFGKIDGADFNMTVTQIEALTKNVRTAKIATASGQIKSYYGFKNENVNTKIATSSDIAVAQSLGNATTTFVMDGSGKLVELKQDKVSNISESDNYTNDNVSGMYFNASDTNGLLTSYSDSSGNDPTIKYKKFRMTIVP